jgi:ribosome assembly protein YihI (activator of Der GTPase)
MKLQDRVDEGDDIADEEQAGLSKAIDRINGLIHKARGFEPTV